MSSINHSPLDSYRCQASCTVKELQRHFDDEKCLEMRRKIWNTLEKDPLFQTTEAEITEQMDLDECRRLAHMRAKRICEYQFVDLETFLEYPLVGAALQSSIGMFNRDCLTSYLIHLTVRKSSYTF